VWFRAGVIALTGLGCHTVFGLEHLPGSDAAIDASEDAVPCVAPNQDDEDNDGVFDACDNCPHVAQLPDERGDNDVDGVGNLCDPNPGKRDMQILFAGFQELPSGFETKGAGAWTLGNGAVTFSGGVANGDYLASFGLAHREVTIDTAATLVAAPPLGTTGSQSFGVYLDIDEGSPVPAFPIGLLFEHAVTPTMRFTHLVETYATNVSNSPGLASLFQVGATYRLRLACNSKTTPICKASSRYGAGTTIPLELAMAASRDGDVGIRVHGNITVAFAYVVIYVGPT
jgi:hypothetical protein